MIRVLNVISGLNKAGTEAVVMNYYRHIDRTKIQYDFLVLDSSDNFYYRKEIETLGGKIYKIPAFSNNPIKNIIARKKFFKKFHYKIVEVHSPSALRYAYCKLAKKSGAKVIFHVHNTCKQQGILIKYARKKLQKYCDEFVTCSQYAAKSVLDKFADKVVFNAIDGTKYAYNQTLRKKIREYYGIDGKVRLIGNIGRFCDQKNQLFLLRAFAEASKIDDNLRLFLRGSGNDSEIQAQIHGEGLESKVIVSAEGSDSYQSSELYNAFDVFFLPSLYEGLPVVAVEAQANLLKIIASDTITDEIVISGGTKRIPLDIDLWVKEMLNEENFKRLSQSEFDFGKSDYNIVEQAKKRENDYLRMCTGE